MCNQECVNANRNRGDDVDDWIEGPCGENPGELIAEIERLRVEEAERKAVIDGALVAEAERLRAVVAQLPKEVVRDYCEAAEAKGE